MSILIRNKLQRRTGRQPTRDFQRKRNVSVGLGQHQRRETDR